MKATQLGQNHAVGKNLMDHRGTMNPARRSGNRTSWERHSRAGGFPWSVRCRPVPVPEGRRRRLAGGKSAPADAAPGKCAEWLRAPAGHRRNGLGRGPMTGDPTGPRQRVMAATLRGGRRQEFLRCPAGACRVRRGNRGPRPLARACPRLISCGVPPGRSAKPASATILRWSAGCQRNGKIRASRPLKMSVNDALANGRSRCPRSPARAGRPRSGMNSLAL